MPLTYKQQFNKKHGQPLDQSNSLKKISELSGIKLSAIKKVFQRGKAAFYTNPSSVRKNVKSATQWGYSRIYSVVMGGAAAKSDADLL